MLKEKLIEKFGNVINYMSCVYCNDGENYLRKFLEQVGEINTAIEIGTFQGVSAAIIAEYAKKVYTIDIEEHILTHQIWSFLDVKNINFYLAPTREDEKSYCASVFKKEKVDFVFIDGEHFNDGINKDFDMVKKCKNILIHDHNSDFPEVVEFCKGITGYDKYYGGDFCLLIKKKKEAV
jgi:hypothetical protein